MSASNLHTVEFVASGRGKAQCPSNPSFPNGIAVKIPTDEPFSCKVALPYPAPECGHFLVKCSLCSNSIAITAAGRRDDPISVEIPCRFDAKAVDA